MHFKAFSKLKLQKQFIDWGPTKLVFRDEKSKKRTKVKKSPQKKIPEWFGPSTIDPTGFHKDGVINQRKLMLRKKVLPNSVFCTQMYLDILTIKVCQIIIWFSYHYLLSPVMAAKASVKIYLKILTDPV